MVPGVVGELEFGELILPGPREVVELIRLGDKTTMQSLVTVGRGLGRQQLFDLKGADLSGLDLSGFTLHAADLTGANLSRCKVEGTGFPQLEGVNLDEASIKIG